MESQTEKMQIKRAGKPDRRLCWRLLVSAAMAAACFQASAQYAIDWSTIDGGGGTSTGGVYSVSGTIAQPDAGRMSGGNYMVEGGFWGIIAAVQVTGSPPLTITLSNGNVIVSWPPPSTGFILQENTDLNTAIWTTVATPPSDNGSTVSVILSPSAGNHYYRLIQP